MTTLRIQREVAISSRWPVHLVLFLSSMVCLGIAYLNLESPWSWETWSGPWYWGPMATLVAILLIEETIIRYDIHHQRGMP